MSEIKLIGYTAVDSGQLVICDPCYIEDEFLSKNEVRDNKPDIAWEIYRHKDDGTLWQYTNGKDITSYDQVNPFPGTYETVIPKYGKKPNDLIDEGLLVKTDLDPTPYIQEGEFSYRGICKTTQGKGRNGQLDFKRGHEGVGVAFSTGGDGMYPVYAEYVEGCIRKVWVEFFDENEEDY